MLEDESVLVINGFFPGLTLKEVRTWMNLFELSDCLFTLLLIFMCDICYFIDTGIYNH